MAATTAAMARLKPMKGKQRYLIWDAVVGSERIPEKHTERRDQRRPVRGTAGESGEWRVCN
jgi:hypothetical protein